MKTETFNAQCPYCMENCGFFGPERLGQKTRCVNCGKKFVLKESNSDSLIDFSLDSNSPNSSINRAQNIVPETVENHSLLQPTLSNSSSSNVSLMRPFLNSGSISNSPEDSLKVIPPKKQNRSGEFIEESLFFGDDFDESLVKKYSERFPNPPQGVWPAGKVLLNGMCQVLPLSSNMLYAEGGVGVVQRVRRRDWNVDLIVKSPKPGVVMTESGKESFERECQTWIELGLHANIVSCYFVRRIDGIPRLFAEFAPDGTLRDWISDKRIYTGTQSEALARLIDISIQFAWGLEHAHRQGLLHLDVKPGNVMMSGSTIKVTDFGLSKFATETDAAGGPVSNYCEGMTPSYCSPEQFEAFQVYRKRREEGASSTDKIVTPPMTKQSDIWSWAISVLSMFHGRSPCKQGGQTAAEVFEVFLKSQEPGLRPLIPREMVELLRWCFRKNPTDRPESMQFIADRLIEIYEEETGNKYPRRQPQNAALSAESFSNKAISLLDLGKTNEALSLLKEASEIAPSHPLITFNYALTQWRSGRILDEQAVKRVEELVKNRSYDPSSFLVYGLTQVERGNLKSAVNAFEHALEMEQESSNVKRLLHQLETLSPLDAQCRTQYVLKKKDEKTPPSLFISDNKETLLLELVDGSFIIISALTGQPVIKFQPSTPTTTHKESSKQQITAVSVDYRWSLTLHANSAIITPVMVTTNQDSAIKQRFRAVNWHAFVERTIKKPLAIDSITENQEEHVLRFVPSSNGVSVIWKNHIKYSFPSHSDSLTSYAISRDGKWMATGNEASEIRIWNVEQQRCVRTFQGLGSAVEAIWFDVQKRYVVTLSKGNCFQFFDVRLLCKNPDKIHAPHQLCLINSSEELMERQSRFEELLKEAQLASKRGNVKIIVENYHRIQTYDGWESTRPIFESILERRAKRTQITGLAPSFQLQAHDGIISTIASSWDSSFLATAGQDSVIRVWSRQHGVSNANQWSQILELDAHHDWVRSIAISPNNRFLASTSWDQTVHQWDLATGKRIRTLPEHFKSPTKLAFAPDGRTLALATANGNVSLHDTALGTTLFRTNVGDGAVHSLVFSNDGQFFVTSTDDSSIRFWNGRNQLPIKEICGFPAPVLSLDVSCDKSFLVAGCANGKLVQVQLTNNEQSILSGHLGEVSEVKLFSDSNWLVSTGKDKIVRFWNLSNQEEAFKLASLDGEINSLTLDYAGLVLFTGAENGIIRRWNLQWDYTSQIERPSDALLKRLLLTISSRRLLNKYFSLQKTSQYDGRVPTRFNEFMIDKEFIQQVYVESQYRGVLDLSFHEIEDIIIDFWKMGAELSLF